MKKSSLPVIFIWFIYGAAVGTCLFLMAISAAVRLGYSAVAGLPAGLIAMMMIGAAVWGAHRAMANLGPASRNRPMVPVIVENLLLVGCLAGMVVSWLASPEDMTFDPAVSAAWITDVRFAPDTAHGGMNIYLVLMHGMMFLLGNRTFSALFLQLTLLVGASLALYFGVRSLSGRVAAPVTLIFLGFGPYMVEETHKLSSFLLVLLFFGLAVAGIAAIPSRMEVADSFSFARFRGVPHYILVGALIGLCFYMDVAGITLLIPLTYVICAGKGKSAEMGNGVGVFLCCLGAAVLSYAGLHGLGGAGSLVDSVCRQLELYLPGSFRIPVTMNAAAFRWDAPVLVTLMAVGVFGFWRYQKIGKLVPWFLSAALLTGMLCLGMNAANFFNSYALLYLFCAAMAGCSLDMSCETVEENEDGAEVEEDWEPGEDMEPSEDWVPSEDWEPGEDMVPSEDWAPGEDWVPSEDWAPGEDMVPSENWEPGEDPDRSEDLEMNEEDMRRKDMENQGMEPQEMERREMEPQEVEESGIVFDAIEAPDAPDQKINYIENPLPLPKKHVRKVLDYDYEVSDDDDFDI